MLAVPAAASRDPEIVAFDYTRRHGTSSSRRVEPHSLVPAVGRWYLVAYVAYDTRANDRRIYGLDRMAGPAPTGRRAPARTLPAPDPAEFVAAKIATAPARHRAIATVHAPAAVVLARTQGLPGRVPRSTTPPAPSTSPAAPSAVSPNSRRPWTPTTHSTPTPEAVSHLRAAAERTLRRTPPLGDSRPEPGLFQP
ncbi:WYL domain-containing protein [Streptomyces sp. NPDC001581]|uniref:WYL domain-containing protein n=1 Tax=Streptomyces sp. NPDC001581 TaxID=3154386 RepID=UPI00331E2B12